MDLRVIKPPLSSQFRWSLIMIFDSWLPPMKLLVSKIYSPNSGFSSPLRPAMAGYLQEHVNAGAWWMFLWPWRQGVLSITDQLEWLYSRSYISTAGFLHLLKLSLRALHIYQSFVSEDFERSPRSLCSKITTVWRVFSGVLIFVESQRKPSELNYKILNFVTATRPVQGRGTARMMIDMCSQSHTISFVTEPLLQTNSMR